MTQNELIDWIVFHLDCNDCPVYAMCKRDQPLTCRDYITNMFQAVDNVTSRAIQDHIERIRRAKNKLMHSMELNERRKLQAELADLRRQLRDVKEYVDG